MRSLVVVSVSLLTASHAFAQAPAPGTESPGPVPAPAAPTASAPTAPPSVEPAPPTAPPGGPPEAPPPPVMYAPAPAPTYGPSAAQEPQPPEKNSRVRRHDSLYFRFGLGIGFAHVSSSGTLEVPAQTAGALEQVDYKATYDGWGAAMEVLLGGTLAKGFVFGGGFVGQNIGSPNVTENKTVTSNQSSVRTNGSFGVVALGPFVDWFPDEHRGLHFGAMAGLGVIGLHDAGGVRHAGVAGSLWGGYDFWIADQWSFGLEARALAATGDRQFSTPSFFFGGASTGDVDGKLEDRASSFELLFTALYQ